MCSGNRSHSFGFQNFFFVRYFKKSQTQSMLIIETILKTKQDLGWTRYTPRLIYLCCYVTI
ncbi:hypothetical protein HanXRQr2_Chr09g0388381 [Helianthus annuus]|uniref:Uncharacterized protein n=1 Tax=Helianthus annuus TaxID=4232 RepID=A0A251TVG5_HELAN|nr:hypothetical protein HanXRQr2_Chr09g0388381 [Helianthus annuus]